MVQIQIAGRDLKGRDDFNSGDPPPFSLQACCGSITVDYCHIVNRMVIERLSQIDQPEGDGGFLFDIWFHTQFMSSGFNAQ